MSAGSWNPWKITAIGLALVMVTAVLTGLVVANWTGTSNERPPTDAKPTTAPPPDTRPGPSPRVAQTPPSVPQPPALPVAPAAPSHALIAECNRVAAAAPSTTDKTVEIVKDSAVGALMGGALGAAGGAIADGGKGAGKGAAIGGLVGGGAGALYGLNENRKNDERYRTEYAACMRARGVSG